jgi:site-specific DNA-cytosine methylase
VPKIETKPKQVGVAVDLKGHDIIKRVYSPEGKSPTINAHSGGNTEPKVVTGGAMRGRAYDEKGKRMDKDGVSVAEKTKQMLELRKDEKSNAITTVGKDSLVVSPIREKSKTVRSGGRGSYDRHEWDSVDEMHWRKLTPLECERLQTVPDGYTEGVSNTQRYRMLGNGWTVDVIAHILTNMEK